MKIQRNRWLPSVDRFEGYDAAQVYEGDGVVLRQGTDHHQTPGKRFTLYLDYPRDTGCIEMEGACMELVSGQVSVTGYVSNPDGEDWTRPRPDGMLKRELWIVLSDS